MVENYIPENWKGRPVLKAADIAPVLEMHEDDVYRLAKNGDIPSFMLGSRRRFRTAEMIRWLAGDDYDQAA